MVSSTEPTTSATSGDEIDGSGRSSAAHSTSGRRRKGAAGAETRTHWRAGELGVAGEPPERALGTSSEVPGLTSAHTRMATALKRLEVAIPELWPSGAKHGTLTRFFRVGRSHTLKSGYRSENLVNVAPLYRSRPPRAVIMSLTALLSLGGFCTDRDPSCGVWATEGECETNPYRMLRTCPHACGQCELVAYDTSSECPAWAISGECDSNVDFMLKNCPTSCGVCAPACEDRLPECPGYAHLGECMKNPAFMLRNCPVVCEACVQACKNQRADCAAWAREGECESNAGFMYRTCPESCGVCDPTSCSDVHENATACRQWSGEGQCATNPAFMLSNCSHACGHVKKKRRHRLRPAGSPEASFSARACLRLPQASRPASAHLPLGPRADQP